MLNHIRSIGPAKVPVGQDTVSVARDRLAELRLQDRAPDVGSH
ncbi:hypothetical protein BN6_79820 [Saccharothrix espanaensis DSM 44229]|uniref:Uncharacterized protein n=1 Tax=Saccharothrix espanaensis (strain ATCC 51144 / DSM 44229 / JCM 9112 / NBRC 15066 / NRRL 15764) TaxID=1179773 RepID=K0K4L5_SACES|nr:hypothetical protein BN6_79820 [Saccharothrix espanaensis DSM 44229]